ncbi:MAG: RNA polymerase sigma factor [Pseudomonadales bacterium]|nr:RNA polymerase sigma factor [Pseudomonadales bacterium]MBO7007502.1 RNA polymerase sigma factor [Pseudomonadales bacterium]
MSQPSGVLYTFTDQGVDRGTVDNTQQALDRFLAGVEKQAFRMAQIATRNPDDALDIVQDSMIKLVEKYSDKPQEEWRPLFFTILNSRIMDYHRKSSLTGRLFGWLGSEDEPEELEGAPTEDGPLDALVEELTIDTLLSALDGLSARQQQVFMLRTWQGFSVAETARMMKCSEGSVKTHLSRATEALMNALHQEE